MMLVFLMLIGSFYNIYANANVQDTQTLKKPIEEIKIIDENIKTLTADFTQEIFFKTAEIKQQVEGKITFSKPANIKIIHTKPQQQIIIVKDKKELTIVKPKDKQIIKTEWEKWKNNLEPRLKGLFEIGNYEEIAKKEDIEIYTENDLKIIIIKSKKNIYTLKLVFSKQNIPLKVELDMGDISVSTTLSNVKINDNISNLEFKYKNKDDFEVLSI